MFECKIKVKNWEVVLINRINLTISKLKKRKTKTLPFYSISAKNE